MRRQPMWQSDGDHPSQPLLTPTIDPTTVLEPKRVKEIHALVKNQVYKAEEEVVSSNSFWPGFVFLLEQNAEGEISCMPYQIEAQELSFPTSTCAEISELIWSVKRAKNRGLCTAGWNPAWAERSFFLGDLLNSKFCETLGHKNTSKYLSNHAPKVGRKHPLVLLLTGQRRSKILLTG